MSNTTSTVDISAMDRAIKAAKARREAKLAGQPASVEIASNDDDIETPFDSASDKPAKKQRMTDEERAAKQAAILAEREARKAAKAAIKAEKQQSTEPRLTKLDKAAEKLVELDDVTTDVFNTVVNALNTAQTIALITHLQHSVRVKSTLAAAQTSSVEIGDTVEIVSGDPRWVGKTGKVTRSQRIRCYVEVEGSPKEIYLFKSDVKKVC